MEQLLALDHENNVQFALLVDTVIAQPQE